MIENQEEVAYTLLIGDHHVRMPYLNPIDVNNEDYL